MTRSLNEKKVVFITGASSGMGKETAKTLIAEGYTVFVAARRLERMKDLEELGATAIKMDISQEDEIQAAVKLIEDHAGGVDILINNAGFGSYGAMEDTSLADARYQFEVNLFGLARLTQLILPKMRAKKWGKVVNISSMGGKIYTPLGSWYHATKHALEGWSDCLRLELAPFGIDVIIVEPGIIQTEFGDVMSDPMLKRSGDTAYADLAHRVAQATQKSYEAGGGTAPEVIAKLILKAIRARRPRTRYVAGKLAKPLMFVRRWFSDRAFDKAVMSSL